jgi:hypothetical protein
MKILVTALTIGAALAGCATLRPARMVLPAPLSTDAQMLTIEGIGGWHRGTFSTGSYRGEFERSATRLAFLDPLYEQRNGRTLFRLHSTSGEGTTQAECRMKERTITISVVEFKPKPMAYRCDFERDGRPLAAQFELLEVRESVGSAFLQRERRGEMSLDSVALAIHSAHEIEGSPLKLAIPIGYRFEQNGHVVAAVELNGKPVMMLARDATAAQREAVLLASLALGLFWDPADSAAGPDAD